MVGVVGAFCTASARGGSWIVRGLSSVASARPIILSNLSYKSTMTAKNDISWDSQQMQMDSTYTYLGYFHGYRQSYSTQRKAAMYDPIYIQLPVI